MVFGERLPASQTAESLQPIAVTTKSLGCVAAFRASHCRSDIFCRLHDSIIQQALAVVKRKRRCLRYFAGTNVDITLPFLLTYEKTPCLQTIIFGIQVTFRPSVIEAGAKNPLEALWGWKWNAHHNVNLHGCS